MLDARTRMGESVRRAAGLVRAAVLVASVVLAREASAADEASPAVHAQLDRGEDVYFSSCVECHNADLSGGASHSAPPLAGAAFRARWKGRSVRELLELTRTTMPAGQPGSLAASAYLDVVAFVLRRNGVALGDAVLDESVADRKKVE